MREGVFPGVFLLSRRRLSGLPVDFAIGFGPGLIGTSILLLLKEILSGSYCLTSGGERRGSPHTFAVLASKTCTLHRNFPSICSICFVGADEELTKGAGMHCPARALRKLLPVMMFQALALGQPKSAAWVNSSSAPTLWANRRGQACSLWGFPREDGWGTCGRRAFLGVVVKQGANHAEEPLVVPMHPTNDDTDSTYL